jgi:hypothetical protein
MTKLMFIVIGGAGVILLIAFARNAEFNVLRGRPISHAQEEVITDLFPAAVLGAAISCWFKYWESDPRRWKD